MKIKNYYQYAALTSLHASIVALIPPFLLVCVAFVLRQHMSILLFTFPFILYSFISYQIFLVHKHRIEDSKEPVISEAEESVDSPSFAIQFLPAPSLRMLLFSQNGQLNGEVMDAYPKKVRWFLPYFIDQFFSQVYTFSMPNGEVLYTFVQKGNHVQVIEKDGNKCIGNIQVKSSKRCVIETNMETREVYIQSSSFFTDIRFYNTQGNLLGRVRRGFLPQAWDKHFKDANTPMLTFHEQLTDFDKILLIAILAKMFRYRNH
jgi:hypothetical protein